MGIKDIIEISVLLILFVIFIIWILFTIHSIKLSNRLNKHLIKKQDDDYYNVSISDKIMNWYSKGKKEMIDNLLISAKVRRIDKIKKETELSNAIDSVLLGFLFVAIYLATAIFYLNKINIFSVLGTFILGFVLPGLIFIIKNKIKQKNIENNLLKVITLINNSLESNKSIKEAIIDARDKIDGDLKNELSEVIIDLDHGLNIEEAFKRMEYRCGLEDIIYLTTTLSILSRTGGNLKEVFKYLEDLFQTRKQLNRELEASIASAKMVYAILAVMPVLVFCGMIIIYDNYLTYFFTTALGNLLGASIIVLYLGYVLLVRKIMIIDKY